MMINTAVFDLDGTLTIRETGNIPSYTIDALSQLRKQGIVIILATGRPYYEIDPVLINEINADYIVSLNWRVLFNKEGKMIKDQPINSETVKNVLEYAKKNEFEHAVHTQNKTKILSGTSIQTQIENIIRRSSNRNYTSKLSNSDLVYNIIIRIDEEKQLRAFKDEFPDLIVENFA